MKLPQVNFAPPSITLDHQQRDTLVALYNEMISVHTNGMKFSQDDCSLCVIGNGIRAGIFDDDIDTVYDCTDGESPNRKSQIEFNNALKMLGLNDINDDDDLVENFLFQGDGAIHRLTPDIQLPNCVEGIINPQQCRKFTALDACIRIAAVLSRAGYNCTVSQLPEIPNQRTS